MDVNKSFDVVTSGSLLDGFQHIDVQSSFAELFKCSHEKAGKVIGSEVTLKKQVDQRTAQAYKQKLEEIGLTIELRENKPTPPSGFSLALEPTEEELKNQQAPSLAPTPIATNTNMTCPKCNLEQPKAEQCTGCGVYMHKVMKSAEPQVSHTSHREKTSASSTTEIVSNEFADGFGVKAFAAAALAALVGAVVWKMIALEFDRELGLVAWGIGGAVGFAAALFGSRGQNAGVMCAALTVAAILGGKVLFYSEFQSQIMSAFSEVETEEIMRNSYDLMMEEADKYALVNNDQSLRSFMSDYGYSEFENPSQVTQTEINEFKSDVAPELINIHESNLSYEEWMETSVAPVINSVGTFTLVLESLDWVDLLFLLFGVATAYRLGSRES